MDFPPRFLPTANFLAATFISMTKIPYTETKVLHDALRVLARDIVSEDGAANVAIAEGADRISELGNEVERLERENAALREELEDVRRVRYSLEDSLDHAHAQAEACLRDKAVLGGKRKVYRIRFDWIGPDTGTHYYKVQRLGLFGIWWTVASLLQLEAAKGLILALRDSDEKEDKS